MALQKCNIGSNFSYTFIVYLVIFLQIINNDGIILITKVFKSPNPLNHQNNQNPLSWSVLME